MKHDTLTRFYLLLWRKCNHAARYFGKCAISRINKRNTEEA